MSGATITAEKPAELSYINVNASKNVSFLKSTFPVKGTKHLILFHRILRFCQCRQEACVTSALTSAAIG